MKQGFGDGLRLMVHAGFEWFFWSYWFDSLCRLMVLKWYTVLLVLGHGFKGFAGLEWKQVCNRFVV